MSLLLLLLVFVSMAEEGIYRVKLHRRQNQQQLNDLVNMIEKTHAQLLEKTQYFQVTPHEEEEGRFKIETVFLEKPNTLAANKKNNNHNNNNKNKQKQLLSDEESLMDVIPLTAQEEEIFEEHLKEEDNLHPISRNQESEMEKQQHTLLKKESNSKSAHADVPLTNVGNTMFIGEMQVGTQQNNNKFNVIFDTGSALTCIASDLCKDIGCQRSRRYDRHESKTFDEIGKEIEITFGSGTLRGLVNREQMNVDGLQLDSAVFIEITEQIGDAFHEGDFDGIVGLGYPHMTGVPTLFDYMLMQHKLEKGAFTFHLNRENGDSGSQLIFGGYDKNEIKGEWVFHEVHEKFYWTIMATQILVGGVDTEVCSPYHKCKMVVDTGTTLMTGPSKDLRKVLSMIQVAPKCSNFYEMPDITFIIGGREYSLSPQEYILTITKRGVEPPYQHSKKEDILSCAGTLFPLDIGGKQGPLWILGDVFITKYNAMFDRDSNQVGLALSKHHQHKQ